MDHELLNVVWVTACIVAGVGFASVAVVLLCKACQRCRHRCCCCCGRRRGRHGHQRQSAGDGGCCCCCCCQLPSGSAAAAATAARAVAATAASAAANAVAATVGSVGHHHHQQQQQPSEHRRGGPPSSDTFDDFLQLSFNHRQPAAAVAAPANGPTVSGGRRSPHSYRASGGPDGPGGDARQASALAGWVAFSSNFRL